MRLAFGRFATPPDTKYAYLCDGYGSDHVYAFDRTTGKYMNKSWGGRSPAGLHPGTAGPTQPHGLFMENHGCTYDPRPTTEAHTIVVSDRYVDCPASLLLPTRIVLSWLLYACRFTSTADECTLQP